MKKKWFKRFFLSLAMILTLALILLLLIILYPSFLINESNLNKLVKYLENDQMSFFWEDADVNVKNISLLKKDITLSFYDVCLKYEPSIKNLCLEEIHLSTRYNISLKGVQIERIGPTILKDGRLEYQVISRSDSAPLKEIPLPTIQKPAFLKNTFIDSIKINFSDITILTQDQKYQASFNLHSSSSNNKSIKNIYIDTKIAGLKNNINIDLNTELSSSSLFKEDDWNMVLNFSTKVEENNIINGLVSLNKEPNKILYKLTTDIVINSLESKSQIQGYLEKNKISMDLSSAINIENNKIIIDIDHCHFSTESLTEINLQAPTELQCHILGKLPDLKSESSLVQNVLQNEFELKVTAELDEFILNTDKVAKGNLELNLLPIEHEIYKINAHLTSQFSGKLEDSPEKWKINSKYSANMEIKEFEHIVEYLKSTIFAIPAPFNTLTGPANFSTSGDLNKINEVGDVTFSLNTDWYSKNQKFILSSNGNIGLDWTKEVSTISLLNLDAKVNEIILELPSLNVLNLPRFLPDQRISKNAEENLEEANEKPLPFPINLSFKTTGNDSFKLITHLLEKPIPFGFDIKVNNSVPDGSISMDPFTFEIFKRKATLEKMNIDLKNSIENSEVNSKIKVDDADYQIFISIIGTFDRPAVIFESEPYLNQEDIISVLLYGEPYNDLDVDDADSVGSFNAARSNKAISMFSLFMLGSTPIQNIGYDPNTQSFSAKLRLGDKTSANIGSSKGEKQLSLRQRLGNGWGISTTITNSSEKKKTKGSALIEWQKRY
jgi:hypothetical protein